MTQAITSNAAHTESITPREIISYGMADFGQTAVIQFSSMYLLFFYTDILAVSAALIGTIFVFSRLWDAINDPIMGLIVDHTHTRFGRCRPYLIPTSVALTLFLCIVFSSTELTGTVLTIYIIITYNLFNMAYTSSNLPLTAQLPLMTNNLQQRIRLSSVRAFSQAIAYASVPLIAEDLLGRLGGHQSASAYRSVALVLGIVCIGSFTLAFFNTRERVTVHSRKLGLEGIKRVFLGRNFWLLLLLANVLITVALIARISSAIYYFTYVVQDMTWFGTFMMLATLSMIPCSIAATFFAVKVGKKNFAIWGCIVGCAGNFLMLLADESLLLGGTLAGCSAGAFLSVLFAMEGDVADEIETRTGLQAQAIVCSAIALGYKVGLGLGTAVVGWLLGSAGYVPNSANQLPAVLAAINVAFIWVPLVATVLAIGVLLLYRLETTTVPDLH